MTVFWRPYLCALAALCNLGTQWGRGTFETITVHTHWVVGRMWRIDACVMGIIYILLAFNVQRAFMIWLCMLVFCNGFEVFYWLDFQNMGKRIGHYIRQRILELELERYLATIPLWQLPPELHYSIPAPTPYAPYVDTRNSLDCKSWLYHIACCAHDASLPCKPVCRFGPNGNIST